ncbi:hypothetical protein KAW43_02265 [Candidatus Parcubacteria bacterium]|nr:hypothetical protein [Candidatus Parcubacteria bacterium]
MGLCILGSSLLFSAQGGRSKEKNCKPAEKIAVGSEGEAEGGNSASPERQSSQSGFSSKKVRILTNTLRQLGHFDNRGGEAAAIHKNGARSAAIIKMF